jgi:hypothetical protein
VIASEDDARLLFGRWKEDAPPLRVKLISNSLVFEATGTVGDFTHGTLQLNGPAWQFTVPLTGAEFTFSDPREIPVAAVRNLETSRYEFGLALGLPSGDRLVLMEIKQEPKEANEDDEPAQA